MIKLELEPDEMKMLEETLERGVSDLGMEVGHTDSHDFKERLKERRAVLERLLDKVRGAKVPA